jgi:hypothetical protein
MSIRDVSNSFDRDMVLWTDEAQVRKQIRAIGKTGEIGDALNLG